MSDHIEAAASLKDEQQEATARPWRSGGTYVGKAALGLKIIAQTYTGCDAATRTEAAANAALIVKAVNAHDALVKAIETAALELDKAAALLMEHYPISHHLFVMAAQDARAALAQAATQ